MRAKPTHEAKQSQPQPARAGKRTPPSPRRKAVLNMGLIRRTYGLSQATFARALGLSQAAFERWEEGEAPVDLQVLSRLGRVKAILEKAARTMRRDYVPTWVEKPSPACEELGARAPIDLMERGDYDAVDDLLFFLGSGVPY